MAFWVSRQLVCTRVDQWLSPLHITGLLHWGSRKEGQSGAGLLMTLSHSTTPYSRRTWRTWSPCELGQREMGMSSAPPQMGRVEGLWQRPSEERWEDTVWFFVAFSLGILRAGWGGEFLVSFLKMLRQLLSVPLATCVCFAKWKSMEMSIDFLLASSGSLFISQEENQHFFLNQPGNGYILQLLFHIYKCFSFVPAFFFIS